MKLIFRETDGVTGDRLTMGEAPIADGQVLIRSGRHIRGSAAGSSHFPVTVVDGDAIDLQIGGGSGQVLTADLLYDPNYFALDGLNRITASGTLITHDLLSVTHHGDTIPAAVQRGDLVVGQITGGPTTTTGAPPVVFWQRLAIGGDGKYLRSDGLDVEWSALIAGDMPAHGVTGGTLPKAATANTWADSILKEAAGGIEIPTAKYFGLGAAKGRIEFVDAATNYVNFLACYSGWGTSTPATVMHIYRNDALTTPQFLIEQDSTGDASLEFLLTGGQAYTIGIDNSETGDIFKISPEAALSNTDYFTMNTTGEMGMGVAPQSNTQLTINRVKTGVTASDFAFVADGDATLANAVSVLEGFNAVIRHRGTQNITGDLTKGLGGAVFNCFNYATAGTVDRAYGFRADVRNFSTGTITDMHGVLINYAVNSGGGVVTNFYGVRVGNLAPASSLNYAFYTDMSISGTTKWAFFGASTAPSRLNGALEMDSDIYGVVCGEGQDTGLLFDGTHFYIRNLVNNANTEFIFDNYTIQDMDCIVNIKAGEAKNSILQLTCDEHDDAADAFRITNVYNATSANNLLKIQCDNAVLGTFVDLVTVTTAGNVGIGTTAPAYQLEVGGVSAAISIYNNNTGANDVPLYFRSGYTDLGNASDILATIVGAPDDTSGGRLIFSTVAGIGGGGTAGTLYERVRIQANGNVGIGTIAPVSLTEIQGGLTTVGAVLTLGTKETTVVVNDVLGRINFYSPLETDGSDAILVGASIVAIAEDTFSTSVNKTSLLFQTGASEVATTKMCLTSAGKLGLSTVAPGGIFDIGGDGVYISETDHNIIGNNYNQNGEAILHINLRGYQDGITQFRDLNIGDGKDGNVLYVDGSASSVGIGTTAPKVLTHIYKAAAGHSVTPDTAMCLALENSDSTGIEILTPNDKIGNIWFTDDSQGIGRITYNHSTDFLNLIAVGNNLLQLGGGDLSALFFAATADANTNDRKIGIKNCSSDATDDIADQIFIYSKDSTKMTVNGATLALFTEAEVKTASAVCDRIVSVWIRGTEYLWMLALAT